MPAYSSVLDRALVVAAQAHRQQLRKGTAIPYIVHPAHVAMVLLKYQFPEEVVVAAVLHDVVEDTDIPLSQISEEFGQAVARLVDAVSEKKTEGGKLRSWRERKQEKLAQLAAGDSLIAAVKAADALHNCHAMLRDLQAQGEALWSKFRGSSADQLWYYTSLAAISRRLLGGHPLCDELDSAVAELAAWHQKTAT
ncbi:MAG: bifunctional (p)ppGpp synthetase/guanosine-3',5'-bis(diphosphate) 3'-pyrophosphohydrolase [Myxococcales bacterium]|nr:bifunctional (p)ppGpp synthetase/guanosine-3',5'-bis(diphosphate) 3'-pyrophosphohydrolase [Myxococcales bacterium]